MTCALSRDGTLPAHAGAPCWTWTCAGGAACGHGHVDGDRERELAGREHQLAHVVEGGALTAEQAAGLLQLLREGEPWPPNLGAPTVSMEHAAPPECRHCLALREAGMPELAEQAAAGGA